MFKLSQSHRSLKEKISSDTNVLDFNRMKMQKRTNIDFLFNFIVLLIMQA